MRSQSTLKKIMRRPGRFGLALAALMLLGTAASSLAAPEVVIPPSALPYGLSYEEWSAKWWQWSFGLSTNHMEVVGNPGICSGPASSVRFLGGAYGFGTNIVTRHVTIAPGTPLFFSVLSFGADNTACPITDFTSYTAEQLTAEAVGGWAAVDSTTCTIDGVSVDGMEEPTNSIYNVVAPAFSYTTAEKHNSLGIIEGEYCIPGGMTIYPAVADGVYLMLGPLKPGRHIIQLGGVAGPISAPFIDDEVTYIITVEE
jgi:hypothetical protein